MAPSAEPDLAGFAAAQNRLRDHFGELVIFLTPVAGAWPPGTPIDPETQKPYDPVIAAQASGMSSAAVNANVVTRPYGKPDVEWAALGAVETDHVMLIAGASAFPASAATDFEVRGDRYKVSSMRFDGIGGIQRHLTFGRKR